MAKIKNRARLRKKLLALPTEVKKMIIPALEQGAQEIVDMQYHLAPVSPGGGDLRNSIDWTWGKVEAKIGLLGGGAHTPPSAATKEDLLISIYAGNESVYYARFVEFGTRPGIFGQQRTRKSKKGATKVSTVMRTHPGTKAQPFFYPGYRAMRKKVKSRIARAVNKAMKNTAALGGAPGTSDGS